VLHLRSVDDVAPYRDALLDAFRRCLTFDPQCEGPRVAFLLDLADAASMQRELRDGALEGLADDEPRNREQAIDVLTALAQRGDEGCEQALRARFDQAAREAEVIADLAWSEIALRGTEGLLRLARKVGGEDASNGSYWRQLADEQEGADEVTRALREAASREPEVAAFVASVEAQSQPEARPRALPPTLDALLAEADAHAARGKRYLEPIGWGRVAPEPEQRKAVETLAACREPARVRLLLRVLSRATVEVPAALLLELAEHEDPAIADAAMRALPDHDVPGLRAFVERSLALDPPRWGALRALPGCLQPGDGARVAALLPAVTGEPDAVHAVVLDLLAAFDSEASGDEAIEPLLWLYEHTPCSLCRFHAVEALDARGALPDWMLAECALDSQSELRDQGDQGT
jgi:hypothetical protein